MYQNHLIRKYFDTQEVVCPHVFGLFSNKAWQFFDPRLLDVMYYIRYWINKPVYVNNWHIGGSLTQRGLRCNVCVLVREKTDLQKVYMTPHYQGTGWDFSVQGMSAEEVRQWIVDHQDALPHPVRLESGVSWVHLDVRTDGSQGKVTFFNA